MKGEDGGSGGKARREEGKQEGRKLLAQWQTDCGRKDLEVGGLLLFLKST